MTNNLKAYVRKTIIEAAREYAGGKRRTNESTEAAFRDAMQGVNSGWWSELIYVNDAIRLASKYRADIRAAVRDFVSETGAEWWEWADRNREFTWADVVAATSERLNVDDYCGDNGPEAQDSARALAWGLCFAVEYLAGELAREYCPDL